jgi:hypothetical protein
MPNLEMITFIYPSLNRSGVPSSSTDAPAPEILLQGLEFGKSYPLNITVGMFLDNVKKYVISIDVFFEKESVLNGNNSIQQSGATIFYSNQYPGHTTFINTLPLSGVLIPKEGVYTVVLSLFESPGNNELGKLLTSNECRFIVTPDPKEQA